MELIQPIALSYLSFSAIFMYCEFGEHVTDRFDEINDALYECNWHLFPYKIQKMLPIIMIGIAKPVKISGFGNISFTRETLKMVFIIFDVYLLLSK